VQASFLDVYANESAAAVSAQPHVLETLAPCLQGPLNLNTASIKPPTARRVACTMALSGRGNEGLGGGSAGEHCSALLTGFSSGSVYAHALELQQVLPCWQDATPQVCWCAESGVRGFLHVDVVGSGVSCWQQALRG
jgi:hypothetical protein